MANVFLPRQESLRYTRPPAKNQSHSQSTNQTINRPRSLRNGDRLLDALNIPQHSNKAVWDSMRVSNNQIIDQINLNNKLTSSQLIKQASNQSRPTTRLSASQANSQSNSQSSKQSSSQSSKQSNKQASKQSTNDNKSLNDWLYSTDLDSQIDLSDNRCSNQSNSDIVVLDDDHDGSHDQSNNRTEDQVDNHSSNQPIDQADDEDVVLQPVTRTNKRKASIDEQFDEILRQSAYQPDGQPSYQSNHYPPHTTNTNQTTTVSQTTTQPRSQRTEPFGHQSNNQHIDQPVEQSLEVQSFDPFDVEDVCLADYHSTSPSHKRLKRTEPIGRSDDRDIIPSVDPTADHDEDLQKAIELSLVESNQPKSLYDEAWERQLSDDEDQPLSSKLSNNPSSRRSDIRPRSPVRSTRGANTQSNNRSVKPIAKTSSFFSKVSDTVSSVSSKLGSLFTAPRSIMSSIDQSSGRSNNQTANSSARRSTRANQSDFARDLYENSSIHEAIQRSLSPINPPNNHSSYRSNNLLTTKTNGPSTRKSVRAHLEQETLSMLNDTTPYLTYPPSQSVYQATNQSTSRSRKGGVMLTRGDIHRLNDGEFFNDSLIEFFMIYLRDLTINQAMIPPNSQSSSQSSVGSSNRSNQVNRSGDQSLKQYLSGDQREWYISSMNQKINHRTINQYLSDRMHMFNTFFYTTFTAIPPSTERFNEYAYNQTYKNVKNWTVKRTINHVTGQSFKQPINLFNLDWLVIPVNDNARHHWALIIVCFPYKEMIDQTTNRQSNAQSYNQPSNRTKQSRFFQTNKSSNDPFKPFVTKSTRQSNIQTNSRFDGQSANRSDNLPGHESRDPSTDNIRSLPCIVVLDSLSEGSETALNLAKPIYEYLRREWETQHDLYMQPNNQFNRRSNHQSNDQGNWTDDDQSTEQCRTVPLSEPTRVFNESTFPIISLSLPRQSNDHDCGPFLVEFMKCFFLCPFVDTSFIEQSIKQASKQALERSERLNNRANRERWDDEDPPIQSNDQSSDFSISHFQRLCGHPSRTMMHQMILDQHGLQQALKRSNKQSNNSSEECFIPESPNVKQSNNHSNNHSPAESNNQPGRYRSRDQPMFRSESVIEITPEIIPDSLPDEYY